MNDSLAIKNHSLDSPRFSSHLHAFTVQNSKNFKFFPFFIFEKQFKRVADENLSSHLSKHQSPAEILKGQMRQTGSFQNILKLSLNAKIEKMMFSEDSLLVKNIKFREENEFQDGESCSICEISFSLMKIKLFCVCPQCSSHKIYSDKVVGYKACDLCFLKLLSKEQEKAWKEYFSLKDSAILGLSSELKKIHLQTRKLEKTIEQINEKNKKELSGQDEKLRDLELILAQESEIYEKRSENFKRNQATLKTENDILKDLENTAQKLRAKISMVNIDISQKSQMLGAAADNK